MQTLQASNARLTKELEATKTQLAQAKQQPQSKTKPSQAIAPFLERMHLSDTLVTVVNDPTGEVNRLFGSEKIPDTFFVDEAGELRAAFINVRDWGRPAAFHCVGSMIGRR